MVEVGVMGCGISLLFSFVVLAVATQNILIAFYASLVSVARSNWLLWPTPRASGTLYLTVMANTAGQWHALIGCYGRHRRPVARSN